ncbi:MAG: TlpA family protein disulfide reductase [Lysobacterales bacterium]
MRHCLSILLLVALSAAAPLLASPAIGDSAPGFVGKGVDDRPVRFDPTDRTRPALVLFWATWCPYCKALMPHLQTVLASVGSESLDVYAVAVFEDGELDPAAELKARGQNFTLILEGEGIAGDYGVTGTPGLFLVGRDGKVRWFRASGADPAVVERELLQLLEPAPVERAAP